MPAPSTAHLAAMTAIGGFGGRSLFAARPRRPIGAEEPWGGLERMSDGVWALVSTPLNDDPQASLTVANGGIVAGRSGVALIEGLVSPEGARWLAGQARELTGRAPDHVILTHYHGAHANMDRYLAFLDAIEDAARRALDAGTPVGAAAAGFRPPHSLGDWVAFSPNYYEVAFRAWERELGG